MSNKRLAAVERGLNGVERKVLSAVPMRDAWDSKAIGQELYRLGKAADPAVISGCLHSLRESGLVKRDTAGGYTRIPIEREKPAPLVAQSKPLPATPQTPPVERKTMSLPATATATAPAAGTPDKVDFMAILAEQAASLRKKADELDALALAVGEREQQHQAEVAKFTQLRNLLKDI